MAGYLFQVERALFQLADAPSSRTVVGIETLDDVVVLDGDAVRIREQDKHSIAGRALSPRSASFWKTLRIWLRDGVSADRYFLTTTRVTASALFDALQSPAPRELTKLARDVRRAGAKAIEARPNIKGLVQEVLQFADEDLKALLTRIELHVISEPDPQLHARLVARLALRSGVDETAVIDQLFGWVTRGLLASWRGGRPAHISRQAFINQCRAIESRLERARLLPRPSADVPVSTSARASAKNRQFVTHLLAIEADEDDVSDAIQYFVQFNTEMHRLVSEGDIPDAEWTSRGQRLEERWRHIFRELKRTCRTEGPCEVGLRILERTTYHHCEPIDGQPCGELYMTAGHYHRLADSDLVWWHPAVRRKRGRSSDAR
jgi:hypothetical protein